MTWTVNATGHVDSADAEREVIDLFRDAVNEAKAKGSVATATISGMHHGQVDLTVEAQT